MTKNGKSIWLSSTEYQLLLEAKELFEGFTGAKISWGAFVVALSMGATAARSLNGIQSMCTNCGKTVEIRMVKPTRRKMRPGPLKPPHVSSPA